MKWDLIFRYEKKDYLNTLELAEESELTDEEQQILVILERIFISDQEMKKSKKKIEKSKKPEEGNEKDVNEEIDENEDDDGAKNKPDENEEVIKQKLLVSYLKVSFFDL